MTKVADEKFTYLAGLSMVIFIDAKVVYYCQTSGIVAVGEILTSLV